jgi:hypothetical protein
MKRIIPVLVCSLILWGCSSPKKPPTGNALDTGREFIRASLDGDFETAEILLLKDPQNLQLFDSYKQLYGNLPADKKRNYKEASYTINKFTEVNDSTTLINYSNSYMNKPMEIKVVRIDKNWNVDFKYTGNLPTN